jgi:hypothetical protein
VKFKEKIIIFMILSLMIFTFACKKENAEMDKWEGTYKYQSHTCSEPSYGSTVAAELIIPNKKTFSFEPFALNTYLYTNIQCSINGNIAQISSDPMSQGDQNAGYNSWDFLGGSITKNGNTLTVNYSFKIFYTNGTLNKNPVYSIVYKK